MQAHLQQVCTNIAQHVHEVAHVRIARMVCTFKLDAAGRLWFLWCSSLRLAKHASTDRPHAPMDLEPAFQVKPRPKVFQVQDAQRGRGAVHKLLSEEPAMSRQHDTFRCPSCEAVVPLSDKYEVRFHGWTDSLDSQPARAFYSDEKLRIVTLRFGTGRQKMPLE
jgi:hypothetical protein